MIKSYYWSGKADGGTGSPKYGAAGYPDVNANYMYQVSKVKGKISEMPEVPGLIVYSKSHPHVGIYIGNGYIIESTLGSRGDGVVKRKLDSFWEYFFQCPYIVYPESVSEQVKTVRLRYPAIVRKKPDMHSLRFNYFAAGSVVKVVPGSDTIDKATDITYIKLAGAEG